MENYLIDKNQYIYLTTDGFQEIFQTKTNFKDFELEFKNYREEDFAFYPFYVNDNLNIKISFSYVDRVSYSLNNYNIKITFISRGNEKVYYEDNVNVENTLKIKVFQQNNTIALYLNDNFLNIIKEPILTYSTMGIEGLSSLGFKIKPITLLIPSKELKWTYQQENSNSFIFLNEKSEYVLENIFNKVNTSTNLFKDTIDTKKNNDTTKEEFLNSPNWNVAPIIEKYGIDKQYTFSFFVKSNKTGKFQVYMQNGIGSKYDLSPTRTLYFQIKKENTWEKFSFTTQFSEKILTQVDALLALYTAYGTDMRLRAKMMKMEIGEKATPFDFNNDEKGIDRSSKLLKNIENIKGNTPYTFSASSNDLDIYLNEQKIESKTFTYIPFKENLFRNSYDMSNFTMTDSNNSAAYPIESKVLEENGINFVRTKRINLEKNNTTFSIYNKIKYENIIPNLKTLKNVKISFMARAQQNIKFIVAAKEHGEGIIYPNIHGERIEITTEWKTFSFVFPEFTTTKTSLYYIPINPVSYTDILSLKDFYLDIARYKMEYNDGTDMIPNWIPAKEDNVEYNPSLNIKMLNNTNGVKELPYLQLEEGKTATSYIENKDIIQVLDESVFKVPIKNNIDRSAGTLIYEFIPNINQKEFTIFEIGDFKLIYKNDRYILSSVTSNIPNKQITLIQPLKERKTWILWTWINNNHKLLHIQANEIKSNKNETGEMNGIFNTMNFSPDNFMNGIINNIEIYNLDSLYLQENVETFLKYQKENNQNKIFGLKLNSQIEFFKKPFLESSLVPLDGSPILVRNNDGPMQRQFFFDEVTGKYRDYNEEYFTYLGKKEIKIAYDNLDETFIPTVKVVSGRNKGLKVGNPVSIEKNVIKMTIGNEESQDLFGEEFVVTYRIKNSYNIEFNEKSANDSYIINLDNPNGEDIIVTQEGNRFDNKKLAKEIELNPILNPRHEGFLYITKNSQKTNSFRIQVSSDMVSANGMDSADIMIEAIDEYGNEVLSPYLDIYIIDDSGIETSQYGYITPIINYETMKARNTSGRLYMRYNAPYLSKKEINREKKVYIIIYDRLNKIGTQTSLILKPSSIDNKNISLSIPRNSNIPFEYFSRYFERNNIPEKVLEVLDYDKNNQLTREDLNQLIINQYNLTEMIGATETLKNLEEF